MMRIVITAISLALAAPALAQGPTSPPVAPPVALPGAAADQAHAELRAMKDRLVAALNAKKPDAIRAELTPDVRLTTMDSVLSRGPDGARAYYDKMLTGADRVLEDMNFKAEPDDLSLLYASDSVAVTTGTATAHFRLVGGKELDVPLRWTATSVRQDGQWKVAAAQFGADMFDNPLLGAAKGFATWAGIGGGLIGLLVGWLLGRRGRRA